MFLKSQIIKHDRALDTCLEVLAIYYGSDYYKLKVRWINLGFNKSYYIFNRHDNIKIKKTDIPNWSFLLDKDDDCYRYSRWKQIKPIVKE